MFNGPLQVRHIENMQDWVKKGYFVYDGRKNEPEAKFFSGECAMMTDVVGRVRHDQAERQVRVRPCRTLPYYADVAGAPQNTIIGGASLWVMGGKKQGRIQGRRQVPHLPVAAGGAGGVAPGDRLPADHDGRVRADQEVRLLREEPGHRRRRSSR